MYNMTKQYEEYIIYRFSNHTNNMFLKFRDKTGFLITISGPVPAVTFVSVSLRCSRLSLHVIHNHCPTFNTYPVLI